MEETKVLDPSIKQFQPAVVKPTSSVSGTKVISKEVISSPKTTVLPTAKPMTQQLQGLQRQFHLLKLTHLTLQQKSTFLQKLSVYLQKYLLECPAELATRFLYEVVYEKSEWGGFFSEQQYESMFLDCGNRFLANFYAHPCVVSAFHLYRCTKPEQTPSKKELAQLGYSLSQKVSSYQTRELGRSLFMFLSQRQKYLWLLENSGSVCSNTQEETKDAFLNFFFFRNFEVTFQFLSELPSYQLQRLAQDCLFDSDDGEVIAKQMCFHLERLFSKRGLAQGLYKIAMSLFLREPDSFCYAKEAIHTLEAKSYQLLISSLSAVVPGSLGFVWLQNIEQCPSTSKKKPSRIKTWFQQMFSTPSAAYSR